MVSKITGPIPTHEIYEKYKQPIRSMCPVGRLHSCLANGQDCQDILQWHKRRPSSLGTRRLSVGSPRVPRNFVRENIGQLNQKRAMKPRQSTGSISSSYSIVTKAQTMRSMQTPRQADGSRDTSPFRVETAMDNRRQRHLGDVNMVPSPGVTTTKLKVGVCQEVQTLFRNETSMLAPSETEDTHFIRTGRHSPVIADCSINGTRQSMKPSRPTQCMNSPEVRPFKMSQSIQTEGQSQAETQMTSPKLTPRLQNRSRPVSGGRNFRKYVRPHSTEPRRGDYMRAHAGTGSDDFNLYLLGMTPVRPVSRTPRPELLTVPRAVDAKLVHLIRRDINFIRANVHLAATGGRTKLTRLKHASLISADKSPTNSRAPSPARITMPSLSPGIASMVTRATRGFMWPERRLAVGEMPGYLIKLRQKEANAAAMAAANRPDPEQPPGHVRMPEEERLSTLELLRKAHDELTNELSRLPVRMDTLRINTRREELEQRLTDLEQAISIFSKPKVFIKPE